MSGEVSSLKSQVPSAASRLDGLTPARVLAAEARLLELPQVECPLRHLFAPGVCVREVTMPAGSLIIGHAHRFADLNIMLTGRLTLLQDDGTLKELSAPQTFLGAPGRKIAYIHETVIWQNVWATTKTDVEEIEAEFLDKSPGWQADRAQRLALQRLAREPDRASFEAFLAHREFHADEVRRLSENTADQVPLPLGVWPWQIGESAIEGRGVLATMTIHAGSYIGPMRLEGLRTPLGRYTNHAADPNAEVRPDCAGNLNLFATRDIAGCQGGQPGEEITVDYEQALTANAQSVVSQAKTKGLELCQP